MGKQSLYKYWSFLKATKIFQHNFVLASAPQNKGIDQIAAIFKWEFGFRKIENKERLSRKTEKRPSQI